MIEEMARTQNERIAEAYPVKLLWVNEALVMQYESMFSELEF